MTGSNKILTVSYGTFSCTLEGFDDPFGTMRGIAEYFRDLAADDRYFGAEPPTPDVEMLQSIAQKEVQRRVEARVGDTGIALRQVSEDAEAPAAPAPAPEPKVEEAETLDSGPLAFDDEYLMPDEPEDILTVDAEAAPIEDTTPVETVAEKLRRIRAVVSKSIELEEPQEPFSAAPAEEGDAGAEAEDSQVRSRAMTETIASIAEDLADEYEAEDEDDQPVADAPAPETAPGLGIADEVTEDAADLSEYTDGVASVEPSTITNIAALPEEAESDVEEDEPGNAFEAVAEQAETAETEEMPGEESVEPEISIIDDGDAASDQFEASEEEDAAIVASVSKIVAHDDDAEIAAETEDEVDHGVPADAEPDQAETAAQEAVVEADTAIEDEPQQDTSVPLGPIHDGNGDVGRLLEETDNKLKDDEGIRRRRVISQMRAAVAATKADRIFTKIITREASDAEQQTPYRKDLDRVISRQETANAPTEADNGTPSRPAPLVLVSSQRVDQVEDNAPVAGAQHQREETLVGDPGEASSFREFADRMGATELPDLLEAAAAYSAFIEGQPHFSRPDIMKRVAHADPARQLSRETGLRTFGQLLRQGKIQKLQRGQFIVADDTKFNPAPRIAGE